MFKFMNLHSRFFCAPEGGDGGAGGGAGEGEGGDTGDTGGDAGSVFGGEGGDAGGESGETGEGGEAGTGDTGEGDTGEGDTGGEGEINYDFTGLEIEGVTPEVRDEILNEEGMKGFLDRAKEAGISQEQISLVGEEYVKSATAWKGEIQKLVNQINPDRVELAKTFSPEVKDMIKTGQFQNFLNKTTNDPEILSKVNEAFTTAGQYELLGKIISGAGRKGIGEVGAGAGADKSGMGKPYTKAEYFADLSKHQAMEKDGTPRAERDRFMEKIKENKRLRGVAEIHR